MRGWSRRLILKADRAGRALALRTFSIISVGGHPTECLRQLRGVPADGLFRAGVGVERFLQGLVFHQVEDDRVEEIAVRVSAASVAENDQLAAHHATQSTVH